LLYLILLKFIIIITNYF